MRKTLLGLLCVTLVACGDDDDGTGVDGGLNDGPAGAVDAPPPDVDGAPIVAPAGEWTFVPVDGNVCDDGSATGIGVNPGDSDKLIVYFEGGGACGDYVTCYLLPLATHGPFGAEQLPGATDRPGSIFDRTVEANPFAAYTMVYVPYCTGDLHAGVKVNQYSGNGETRTYHHVGHLNALAALGRLQATWPDLTHLVVTGASAGGYGSVLNYDQYRARWPDATSYLIDDSGPALAPSAIPQLLRDWFAAWGLLEWVPCEACKTDFSQVYTFLAGRYGADRMALLSSLQDGVIRTYLMLEPAEFEAALVALTTGVLDPLAHFEHFYVAGDSHTMLGDPGQFDVQEIDLWTWMTQMVTDDEAWTSARP